MILVNAFMLYVAAHVHTHSCHISAFLLVTLAQVEAAHRTCCSSAGM